MADKIKVLIVDDASFMVRALGDIFKLDPDIEVVGSAKNGEDALEKIKALKPDVVTLDVDMPIMDGITAVRHIMINHPVPIVMLSSLFEHGDITFEALRLGVVDFLPKPSGAISRNIHEQGLEIIERVKIAATEKIENVQRVKINKIDSDALLTARHGLKELEYLVAIGTTLGGPNTVIRLMSQLSVALPAAIVVIQEISNKILPAFVEEFNHYTHWKVEMGIDGMVLEAGSCYICSYEEAISVQIDHNQNAVLRSNPDAMKPLNILFTSVAEAFEERSVGVLLTGVGSDGEYGFGQIQAKKGVTIAQKTETCVYPNLTRCAIENGVVDVIDDVNALNKHIENAVNRD